MASGATQSSINFDPPQKNIPAPCGISLPCSVVELKGQQISVFMLSGMETPSQLKEFIWCYCDFACHPSLSAFVHTKGEEGALQTWERVPRSSFSCSAVACGQLVGTEF